jgi:hypothetical protein
MAVAKSPALALPTSRSRLGTNGLLSGRQILGILLDSSQRNRDTTE